MDCVFCERIRKGEFDYEDENAVAFEPLDPVVRGHFLVVPRAHAVSALDDPKGAGDAMVLAGYLAGRMDIECNIITSAGVAATQTVFHTHIHVVPREADDGLMLPWTGQKRGGVDDGR